MPNQNEFFDYIFARIQNDISEKRKVNIQDVFDEAVYVYYGNYREYVIDLKPAQTAGASPSALIKNGR